ncbi:MAG: monofunctional biosynthetic peptidoglycan transglycosylase [Prevotella sp.]|nr:monofunctional biosynthetic peptidoglycan transglycosylase [Prevotella sp.]MBQ7715920.1 monofunctional biosynthetic peptidoglycan transglycosylase [Prevotella sp.]
MVVAFFASTILAVVLFRFVPVFCTPLMFIRSYELRQAGESVKWKHHWVSIDKISPSMPVAVMASEDQYFLKHHGFDFKAIEQAALKNAERGRKLGASTITQQTAKNVFLWPGRTWVRKGLEAYFTVLIELIWSKQRIMEVYLNSIEMGDGIYGVEAVAQEHFNCHAIDLSRSNCALIAATLPNPRKYSSKYPSDYMVKRKYKIMKEMKNIPLLPREGQDVDPSTVNSGIYKRK